MKVNKIKQNLPTKKLIIFFHKYVIKYLRYQYNENNFNLTITTPYTLTKQ